MILKKVPAWVALGWSDILEKKGGITEFIARQIVAEIETVPKLFSGNIDEKTESDVKEAIENYDLMNKGNITSKELEKEIKEEMFEFWRKKARKTENEIWEEDIKLWRKEARKK